MNLHSASAPLIGRVMTSNPSPVLICSICGKRINFATSKTDEDKESVHEECYGDKLLREQRAFNSLFKAPARIYPSK